MSRHNLEIQEVLIKQDLIDQLYKLTNGRPHALTSQLAHLTGRADQTIRKIHSQTGEFFGRNCIAPEQFQSAGQLSTKQISPLKVMPQPKKSP
jgi:hypothetical protein